MENKIIEIALKEVGYSESPPKSNLTKYGEWFGFDGVAWCAMFVSWCYDQAGYPLGNIGFLKGFAGVPYGLQHWTKTKEITKTPVPGDIFVIDFNGDGKYDHTGLFFEPIDHATFRTIEGNTSAGNQANGGQVQIRVRRYDQSIFIHPKVLNKK